MDRSIAAAYAHAPETFLPVPDGQDLIKAARVDQLVQEVLRRYNAAMAVATPPPPGPSPFDAPEPAVPSFLADPEDFFSPPVGGPAMPYDDEAGDAGENDERLYRFLAATPFDDAGTPFEGSEGPFNPEELNVTQETFKPLQRAVRPTFDTYSRFGYPDLKADPYGNGIINAIRRMVRGAQL